MIRTCDANPVGRSLRGLFVLMALLLLAPVASRASLVVPMTVEDMTAVADDVVYAQVADSATEVYNGKIITRHRLDVIESFKGANAPGTKLEVVQFGGTMGKLGAMSPGMPVLSNGEELVLFLSTPSKHLKREDAPHLNLESPLVKSPQIVGGFQGKFEVVRQESEIEVGGQKIVREDVRVLRDHPGRVITFETAPSLDAFRGELKRLNDTKKPVKRTVRKIPTVGNVSVPEALPTAASLRVFDPLPAFASEPPVTVREAMERERKRQQLNEGGAPAEDAEPDANAAQSAPGMQP